MQVRDIIREKVKRMEERKDEMMLSDDALKTLLDGVKSVWEYLDRFSETQEPLSYQTLSNSFGDIDRKRVEEVFRYAIQKNREQGLHKEQRKLASKANVQKRGGSSKGDEPAESH